MSPSEELGTLGLLFGGEEFVNNEGGVKEEVVEEKDGAKWGGMEEDPLRILPEELIFEGEGLVNEEVKDMEDIAQ